MIRGLTLATLVLAVTATGADAQLVELRPIDRATVRIIGISGVERVNVTVGGVARVAFHPRLSHGTGVVVGADGRVLTAAHVVRDLDLLAVILPGADDEHPGVVSAIDREHDVAFVQVPGPLPDVVALPESPPTIAPGQTLHVSGYPIDVSQRFPAAASGTFSRVRNDGQIELSMSLNPGNSGGPLVDAQGRLVGVISARGDLAQGIQGIAVAEPIQRAIDLVDKIDPDAVVDARGVTSAVRWALSLAEQGERRDAAFPDDAPPSVAALAAHRAWANALLILSTHSVALPMALPPDAKLAFDKEMATLDEALRLAESRADVETRQRYDLPALRQAMAQVNNGSVGPAGYGVGTPPTGHVPRHVGGDDPNRVRRFRLSFGPSLPIDPLGFAFRAEFHGDLVATDWFAMPLGAAIGIGAWPFDRAEGNSLALVSAMIELGARLRLGSADRTRPFVEAVYGVGFMHAEGRQHFVYRRYRVSLGIERGSGGYMISYREEGRDADATLRSIDLAFMVRF
ncbi:MAG: trypsin-like peptidase domain-containing protein [Deltaproteobacteria bacterium]|nr:trypsin-like peptidase domain-containing protein [Deltaproteobacteria bacterium]